MDSTRFDRWAMRLGARLSRRRALAGAAAGFTAVAVSVHTQPLSAQDATPDASPDAGPALPAFLFVQLAESGTWEPKPGEDGVYRLTMRGAGGQTLYFSDRPDRIVGTMDTDRFLDALGFTPVNPPNAAVVVQTPEGERDVLVVELFNPVYSRSFGDSGEEWLTYEARVLNAYQGEGLEAWAPQADDDQLPQEFTNVSLFIDDCADLSGCYRDIGEYRTRDYVGEIPGGPYGRCFNYTTLRCVPCICNPTCHIAPNWYYDQMCNDGLPGCHNECYTDTCGYGGWC